MGKDWQTVLVRFSFLELLQDPVPLKQERNETLNDSFEYRGRDGS